MANILILGAHSFVGQGLQKVLAENHHTVELFSRGVDGRRGNTILGDYLRVDENSFFAPEYDVVINLAVLKDRAVEDNVQYIRSLVEFCKSHKVKKLIHFSSIMVYDYQLSIVDEQTPAETQAITRKRGYGEIKIAVDEYLQSVRDTLPFELVLVRPGYVLADGVKSPFIINLPLGIHVIKGNKRSKQPIVRREDIHKALLSIINKEQNNPIYHFFPLDGMTKFRYAKQTVGGVILTMPKWFFERIPYALAKLHVISWALYSRFEGMYIYSDFHSEQTEQALDIHFTSI